jgi:signal transduction histidine kinase
MSSATAKPFHSAAWRISLWATLAFACGTMLAFLFLLRFMAGDIQRRSDAWLSGEVDTLSDVAERTPKGKLYARIVGETEELASREVPDRSPDGQNESVFFLQTTADGSLALWAGDGNSGPYLQAIRQEGTSSGKPFDVHVKGTDVPFRVAAQAMPDGGKVYLGLSENDELRVLHTLQIRFLLLWFLIVLLGFTIVFYTTRRMLRAVRNITEAASRIGESDLMQRVPVSRWNDEVAHLSSTLNRMLDRIERSVHQLHTITNSLAHDMRSPLTAIRAKLEIALTQGERGQDGEAIESAIDEVDQLTEMLSQSLDVAEAKADALRLDRAVVDLDKMLRSMVDLYSPCMSEKGLGLQLHSAGHMEISADRALLHRMVANLFDNELKHLPASCTVNLSLSAEGSMALLIVEDDGPGFETEIFGNLFQLRTKGRLSSGKGLGLAFVEAVVATHSGRITAVNRPEGGARLTIELPLAAQFPANALSAMAQA